ncbi:ATP-binding protein [Marinospirillum sp. MEB164]|uniref:histidine kinase n=1 Tax=Marinospirillum alkalitolerans TaxID=3123374 RepID=A0ABW8PY13_9GAMM
MPSTHSPLSRTGSQFWLLPVLAIVFLCAALSLMWVLQNQERQMRAAERDDALWAAYQLDRENLKFAAQLSEYQARGQLWANVDLRFEILYSRMALLQRGQFAQAFGAHPIPDDASHLAANIIAQMDAIMEQGEQAQEQVTALLNLSQELQATTEPLINFMKGETSLINSETRKQLRSLYQTLFILIILLTLTMSGIILVLIRHTIAARQAQYQAQAMTQQLEITAQEAKAANQAKTDFLATLSHEIRTPMNGVLGLSDLLRETQLDKEQRKYTDAIFNSAHSLMQLLNDLLDVSRLEAGKLQLYPQPVQLAPLLEETVDFFAAELNRKTLDLQVELAPSARGWYRLDPLRLRQVLLNLLGNALKFTEQGSIRLTLWQTADRLHCHIEDTGIGISAEAQQHLFAIFSQADSSIARRYGGTGLGLAICKGIIEQMGGQLELKSETGQGSCFFFALPIIPTESEAESAQQAQHTTD